MRQKRAGGQSGTWAGSESDSRSGSDKLNGVTVVRRACLSVESGLQAVQASPGGGGIGTSVARVTGAQCR
jgi:hypothetical protein